MPVIYTVIFGPYEELKAPRVVTQGWKYICFTDQPFTSEVWQVIPVDTWDDKRMHSREYKINFDKYIEDDESIYIDGSFIINCNLTEWWNKYFLFPMTFVHHPRRNCVFKELKRCIQLKRCNLEKLKQQKVAYFGKVKNNNGLIQSGLMMRRKTPEVISLMREWWNELQKYSTRDQISMAYVARNIKLNAIIWNYATATEFIYVTHYARRKS